MEINGLLQHGLQLPHQHLAVKFSLGISPPIGAQLTTHITTHLRHLQYGGSQAGAITGRANHSGMGFRNHLCSFTIQHTQQRHTCHQIRLHLSRNRQTKNRILLEGDQECIRMGIKGWHPLNRKTPQQQHILQIAACDLLTQPLKLSTISHDQPADVVPVPEVFCRVQDGGKVLCVADIAAHRFDLLDEATTDAIHQRQRAALFPHLFDIFGAAKGAGAHAAWLSGAGSSVAAICTNDTGRTVAGAMLDRLKGAGLSGRCLTTRIAAEGASVARVELVDIPAR